MELFSAPWWSALLAIVLIDLVLAGDNAIVIALAAAGLPKDQRNKVILIGIIAATAGAIKRGHWGRGSRATSSPRCMRARCSERATPRR